MHTRGERERERDSDREKDRSGPGLSTYDNRSNCLYILEIMMVSSAVTL